MGGIRPGKMFMLYYYVGKAHQKKIYVQENSSLVDKIM